MLNLFNLKKSGFSLRTGGYIVAILGWIGSLIYGQWFREGLTGAIFTLFLFVSTMVGCVLILAYGTDNNIPKYNLLWLGMKRYEILIIIIMVILWILDLSIEGKMPEPLTDFGFFVIFASGFWYLGLTAWGLYLDRREETQSIVPVPDSQSPQLHEYIPMKNVQFVSQSSTETLKSPPPEMV